MTIESKEKGRRGGGALEFEGPATVTSAAEARRALPDLQSDVSPQVERVEPVEFDLLPPTSWPASRRVACRSAPPLPFSSRHSLAKRTDHVL
jgi:hypothetical protein